MFEDHQERGTEHAVELVEATIKSLGVDPASARVSVPDAIAAYGLNRGSARVRVVIFPGRESRAATIRVSAPVVKLEPVKDPLALFRRLLEVNARELDGAAFAVSGDDVVIVAQRSVEDLDGSEVEALLRTVGRAADHYDDVLAEAFKTRRSSDS